MFLSWTYYLTQVYFRLKFGYKVEVLLEQQKSTKLNNLPMKTKYQQFQLYIKKNTYTTQTSIYQ